jgi:hypothetical protein
MTRFTRNIAPPASRVGADVAALPWYRHGMVWLLIAFPLSSVIVGISMLVVSITTYDGLVVDDYYKQGLQINRRLARDRQARAQGLKALLQFDAGRAVLRLTAAGEGSALPQQLQVHFRHATRGGLDKTLLLTATSPGHYQAAGVSLEPGRWHVEAATPDWRITAAVDAGVSTVSLEPGE